MLNNIIVSVAPVLLLQPHLLLLLPGVELAEELAGAPVDRHQAHRGGGGLLLPQYLVQVRHLEIRRYYIDIIDNVDM